jgi:hypothetical protein
LEFPALGSKHFIDSLKESKLYTEGNISLPTDYTKHVQLANNNPVAVALEFQTMIENVLTILIGCKPTLETHSDSKQV